MPTLVWVVWLVVTAGGFIVFESMGLFDGKPGRGTLSDVIWKWLGIDKAGFSSTRHGRVALFSAIAGAICALFAWLIPHILVGWGVPELLVMLAIGAVVGLIGMRAWKHSRTK